MIGVSVGLGNVWRFPYMMGMHGGSAFLILYLIFTLFFAVPALTSEWALGRETRKGPVGAFSAAFGPQWGKAIGSLLIVTVLVADSYYMVVIANVVSSSYFSIGYGFDSSSIPAYQELLSNSTIQLVVVYGVLAATLWVIYKGLNKGIEKVSKLFVPLFALIIIYLIVYVFTLPGSWQAIRSFLKPDLNSITTDVIFAALGQAFFSLGLGGTFILVYGSYLKKEQSLTKSAVLTTLGDTGAAVFVSLFLVPTMLVFGMDMTQGPTLIFSTLPELFAVIPAGRVVGSLFLIALTMVAFLSNVAALEVIATGVKDYWVRGVSQKKIVIVLGLIEAALVIPSTFKPEIIGYLDLIFGSGMQTFGSALAIIALTFGLGKVVAIRQVFGKPTGFNTALYNWTKWAIPATLILILILYIYNSITS